MEQRNRRAPAPTSGTESVIVQQTRTRARLRRRRRPAAIQRRQGPAAAASSSSYPQARNEPPVAGAESGTRSRNIAALPAKLSLVFQGSRPHAQPRADDVREPVPAAHQRQRRRSPPGLVRQKQAVTVSRTSVAYERSAEPRDLPRARRACTAFRSPPPRRPSANSRTKVSACTSRRSTRRGRAAEQRPRRGRSPSCESPAAQLAFQRLPTRAVEQLHLVAAADRRARRTAPASRDAESPSRRRHCPTTACRCRPRERRRRGRLGANENADCRPEPIGGACARLLSARVHHRAPARRGTQRHGAITVSRACRPTRG